MFGRVNELLNGMMDFRTQSRMSVLVLFFISVSCVFLYITLCNMIDSGGWLSFLAFFILP